VFVLTFTGILLSATLVMKERGSAAYFRNFITPVPTILFVIGTYATALIILLIQLVVLFILGSFAFQVSVFSNLGPTSVILLLTCSVFISIGMLIGYTFRSEETTTLAAICVSSVLLLFSSLIVPIENVKSTLASVLQFSPFVLADSALRISLIFDQSIVAIWPQVLGLLIYATLLFLGSYYILRRSLRKM
jgi:ABC-2 type transport system permease protein